MLPNKGRIVPCHLLLIGYTVAQFQRKHFIETRCSQGLDNSRPTQDTTAWRCELELLAGRGLKAVFVQSPLQWLGYCIFGVRVADTGRYSSMNGTGSSA